MEKLAPEWLKLFWITAYLVMLTRADSFTTDQPQPQEESSHPSTSASEFEWSSWSSWTPCSKTCGGGVSMQERQCLPRTRTIVSDDTLPRPVITVRVTREAPLEPCQGEDKRFYECNTAPCGSVSRDPRAEQCASYDWRPFRGRFYTWVPYVDGNSPCILNCRPLGQHFYASLALVADGTPCTKPGSRAICVQGTCKVVLIFGFSGACRTNELTFLTTNNIEKHSDTLMLVKLPDTINNKERNFVIRDEYVKIVEKYQALRPPNTPTNRFFLQYHKGKCVRQPMGINKIASFPRIIATFLGLQAPKQYTGHCFRRTSATLLADSGAGLSTLKRYGGWKSSTVAEAYIEDSIENKAKICKSIVGDIKLKQHNFQPSTLPSTSKDMPVFIDSEPSSLSPTYTPVEFNNVDNTNNSTCISVPNKNVIFNMKNCQNFTFIFDKNQK